MTKDILIKSTCEATQLRVYVKDKIDGDPLWCARYNATKPDAVYQIHLDFLEAGADIIISNTYQASVEGYMEHLGISKEESVELIKQTVQLARKARNDFLAKHNDTKRESPLLGASIGPYGAYLHDGSDYTGNYAESVTSEVIKKWHKARIDAVLEAGVDFLAIETIPCMLEAISLAELLCDDYASTKFWISMQCKDGSTLASGEPFAETCKTIWNLLVSRGISANCIGIGVNCLHPKFVTPLLESINGGKTNENRIPLVVYANSGETYTNDEGWLENDKLPSLEEYVPKWIDLGIKVLGGCCRTKITDIPKFKKIVSKLKYSYIY